MTHDQGIAGSPQLTDRFELADIVQQLTTVTRMDGAVSERSQFGPRPVSTAADEAVDHALPWFCGPRLSQVATSARSKISMIQRGACLRLRGRCT